MKHLTIPNSETIEDVQGKIVHIKSDPQIDGGTHFYWNKSKSLLICGKKVHFPVPSLSVASVSKEKCYKFPRNEVQIGDSVCYLLYGHSLPIMCATVVGMKCHNKQTYFYLEATSPHSPVACTWAPYDRARFFIVSNNHNSYRKVATKNKVYAAFEDELEKIEFIYSFIKSKELIKKYMRTMKSLGERVFIECHKELFGGIYDWGGHYRNEEIVISARNFPTMHPDEVKGAMEDFCNDFATKYLSKVRNDREKMIDALVFAHEQLAWIHPFQDGNGRTIRLYLEIVARTRGFKFNLQKAIHKNKRYYHYSVRASLNGERKHLKSIIKKALE
ncbi:Fic family protein [Vibrio fluvialis]|nr:Fic family protein [Vibrio fluvialis]